MAILLGILFADVPGSIRPVAAMPTSRLWARRERIDEEETLGDCDYLLDTSAVVKRYVDEVGSTWFRNLAAPAAGHFFFLARISDVEVTAALAGRRRQGSVTPLEATTALAQFRRDFSLDYHPLEITIPLLDRASLLADLHALRAYDAVQLSAALEIRLLQPSVILISADDALNRAAVAEGLPVENPNHHP